jgi:hypothetical protein
MSLSTLRACVSGWERGCVRVREGWLRVRMGAWGAGGAGGVDDGWDVQALQERSGVERCDGLEDRLAFTRAFRGESSLQP